MNKTSRIFVAGHKGMVGSAILRTLQNNGYNNLVYSNSKDLDLRNQQAVQDFFIKEKPEYVFIAAAKVGGTEKLRTMRKHFLGTVVIGSPKGGSSDTIATREVIDGQQRITTLQILLLAF